MENHETVQAGQPVVSMVDLSTIEVAVGIPEDFLCMVANITSISCTFDAFPDKVVAASLKEVGKRPNPSNQTYPMTLILGKGFEDRGMSIRPGMTGEVKVAICDKDKDKAFTVPLEAVVNDGDRRSFVWIFEPESECVKRCYVNTLKFMNQGIEITGDMKPGDLVVTAGAQYLEVNQKVRILDPPSETNPGNLL